MQPRSVLLRALVVAVCLMLVGGGCVGRDPNVTETGKSKPLVAIRFPAEVEAGSSQVLEIDVENPGPVDMDGIVVAFSFVGPVASGELPLPVIPVGSGGENPAIESVEPEPQAVSQDGVVFVFDALPEGETITIAFTVKIGDARGVASNAVTVYAGDDVERASGGRLQTKVVSPR